MVEEKNIDYKDVRSQIKNGDILMFKGRNFGSLIIKWFTRSSYSHAGIAVWWNRRLMVMEAVRKGVVVLPLSRKIRSYQGDVEWFSCKEEISKRDRLRMVIFAQEELGKRYGRWKTLLFGWRILFRRKLGEKDELERENKLYCSQYVSQIYNSVGLDLKKKREDRFMSPDDIANSILLERKGIFRTHESILLVPDGGTDIEVQ